MSSSPLYFGAVQTIAAKIVPGDTTTLVTVLTPASAGTRIDSLCATMDDAVANVIQLWFTLSSVDYLIGTVAIPASSGFTSTAATINLLAQLTQSAFATYDANGNRIFVLKNGAVLKLKVTTTLTAAKTLYITGQAMDA
jgi:hypothetical protein